MEWPARAEARAKTELGIASPELQGTRLKLGVRCRKKRMKINLFLIAIILGFAGFAVFSINALLGVGLMLVALLFFIASFRKRRTGRASVSVSTKSHPSPQHRIVRKRKQKFEAIGNTDAMCPHCQSALDKMPGRKKKCPHCGDFIFVRARPSDEQRVLVTEAQAEVIEEQWSIVNGTHGEYLAEKKRFADERDRLTQRVGKEPSDNDVAWSMLNQDMMGYARQRNWGLFCNAKFQMAEILRKESRLEDALGTYLEVCYIDLNGPCNIGGVNDPQLLKEFSPWDPKNNALLAPGILDRISEIIKKMGTDQAEIQTIFSERATKLKQSLRLPVAVSSAWRQVHEALF